jgi:hypothetical protein
VDLAQGASPEGRGHPPDVGGAHQGEEPEADQRRAGPRRGVVPVLVVAAHDREAADVRLDALGDVHVRAAHDGEDRDGDLVVLDLGLAEVEVAAAHQREDDHPSRNAPAALAVGAAHDRHQPTPRLAPRARGRQRRDRRKLPPDRVELGQRLRVVRLVHALRELLQRQATLRRVLAQLRDDLLPLGVGRTHGGELLLRRHLSGRL